MEKTSETPYEIAMSKSYTDDKKRELLKQFSVEELEECASEIEELADERKADLIYEYGEEEYDEHEEYYGQVNDLEYLAELVYDVIE